MKHRGSNPGEQEMSAWHHPEVHTTNPTQEQGELVSLHAGVTVDAGIVHPSSIPTPTPPPMLTYGTAQVAAAAFRMTGRGQAERFQMRNFQRAGKALGFCDVVQTDMTLELGNPLAQSKTPH